MSCSLFLLPDYEEVAMLRYGDGTPFPFGDAFLDMLVDAVEACTAMLIATASLDRRRADADAVLEAIGEEERRLVLLERAVAAACGPAPDRQSTPAMRAAEQTRSAMELAIAQSREQLKLISTQKAATPSWDRTARRVRDAAGRFFARRLLPGTRWAWAWDARGAAARGEAASQDARFRVTFDLDLPHAWSAPVRIDALVPDLVVHLPVRRWLRSTVDAAVPLGRYHLVAARHDDRGRELVIRKPDGSSWRIDLPRDGQPGAIALDRRGRATGTGLVGESELAPLWDALERELPTQQLRREARDVFLGGTSVAELADTTLAARALLDEIGPTVRAIRQRSRMPGELILKRDVSDGVREEIFVSRATLAASYSALPPEHRRLLDDAGFGRGLTTGLAELVAQPELALAAPPAAPAPPARRAAAPPARPPQPRPTEPTLPRMTSPVPRSSTPTLLPPTTPFARASSPDLTSRPTTPRISEPTIATARTIPSTLHIPTAHAASPSPRPQQRTEPLLAMAPRPAAPALPGVPPLARAPAATPDPDRERRRRDDPTIRSVLVAPAPARVPIRRLETPTG